MSTATRIGARRRSRPTPKGPLHVVQVSVDLLFNKVSYEGLSIGQSDAQDSRVSVLYGDNGTGKTTLLRLIYACLSPQGNLGLRSLISRTAFHTFEVKLSDGTTVRITKRKGLVGDYEFMIASPNSPTVRSFYVEARPDGSVGPQDSVSHIEVILQEIGLDILFVDHNRSIRSTYSFLSEISSIDTEHVTDWAEQQVIYHSSSDRRRGKFIEDADISFPLAQVVDAVDKWFRNQAFRQGAAGEQSASAVYLEIARALTRGQKQSIDSEGTRDVRDTLLSLQNATESFVRHGLLSKYPFDELIGIYNTATKPKKAQIKLVLDPFLDSIQRRVTALTEVHDIATLFESELNKYFSAKRATLHIQDGLSISDPNGKIGLDSLSSGEKQLVFLLSAAVLSRSARSLILIDEPELSLNYKWQRLIAASLSNLSAASGTQYILASHSIEIITRYVDTSVELVSK